MKYLEKLNQIQEAASNALIEQKQSTVHVRTGIGKTFIAFKAIVKLLKTSKSKRTVLFLAETKVREATVYEELKKFKALYKIDLLKQINLKFACYQSAYKWKNKHWDIVIADRILFA